MTTPRLLSLAAVLTVLAAAACSSNSGTSGGGGNACASVCDCVSDRGGDVDTCMSECSQIASQQGATAKTCESSLDARGYGSCKSTCSAFSTGSGGGNLAPFCQKCAQCYSQVDEGFCAPFVKSSGFDVDACIAGGDISELANPSASASTVSAWSCKQFDDNE